MNLARRPSGIPAGGQFAPQSHDESGVTLGDRVPAPDSPLTPDEQVIMDRLRNEPGVVQVQMDKHPSGLAATITTADQRRYKLSASSNHRIIFEVDGDYEHSRHTMRMGGGPGPTDLHEMGELIDDLPASLRDAAATRAWKNIAAHHTYALGDAKPALGDGHLAVDISQPGVDRADLYLELLPSSGRSSPVMVKVSVRQHRGGPTNEVIIDDDTDVDPRLAAIVAAGLPVVVAEHTGMEMDDLYGAIAESIENCLDEPAYSGDWMQAPAQTCAWCEEDLDEHELGHELCDTCAERQAGPQVGAPERTQAGPQA